jgi:cobyrinic acid a,c-diamide synthase
MKGFLVCGSGSGVGKTTIGAGLMAAFRKRGLRVQPFKCGPDFIDPGHHTQVCGRPSHNLDTWMLSADQNRRIFASACRDVDIAIVEGMMGLFDGVQGTSDEGSSAEIAKLLGLPVLLVVDASSSARSIAAVVHGFHTFDPQLGIAGVVLNRVANQNHARMLIEALRSRYPALPIGWIPFDHHIKLNERHLGLQIAEERTWDLDDIGRLAAIVEQDVPLDELLESCNIELPAYDEEAESFSSPLVRIGLARDRAFSFYYEAGLAELRRQGAELVEFSPLASSRLPDDLDALYFGGGYPELHAETLSANRPLLTEVRKFAERGNPIYGECGGLMFLGREMVTLDGRRWPMANLLPLSIQMTEKLVHFGYADIHYVEDGLAEKNTWLRGHSFHHSRIVEQSNVEKRAVVHYSLSRETEREGFAAGNVFGSYIHLHFASAPPLAARFLSLARACQQHGVQG